MLKKIRKQLTKQDAVYGQVQELHQLLSSDLKSLKINIANLQHAMNMEKKFVAGLAEVEFQVFSQWGDDGIIQYLVSKLDITDKTFIEFGVENYRESNTRYLLINNNWSGYVIDGSEANIEYIQKDVISWACELYTECSFITAENINLLLQKPGFGKNVGLLSIDIDGNDYWVWKAIDCIDPVIVICEYNALFGEEHAWTIPYSPAFSKYKSGYPISYYGASLRALCSLAREKGYCFVGCNSKGNNAYFIRKEKMIPAISEKSVSEGFVMSKFREHAVNGKRPVGSERQKYLTGLPVFDVELQKELLIP